MRLATLPVLAALGAMGCGGFRTSQSVSPATFLFPRIISSPTQAAPAGRLDVMREPTPQVALVQ